MRPRINRKSAEVTSNTGEIRRMYVLPFARRAGVARAILIRLEQEASYFGCRILVLETGNRQSAATALYGAYGFSKPLPFGLYVNNPTSVCYTKQVEPTRGCYFDFLASSNGRCDR
jgi:hypothetical protein